MLLRFGILVGFTVVTLFPLAWIVSGSFKPLEQVFSLPVQWIPSPFLIENYTDAMVQANFLRPMLNSIFVTTAHVVINLVVGALDRKGREGLGDQIDRRCRWIFPLAYFGLNLGFVAIAFSLN